MEAFSQFAESGADMYMPPGAFAELAGFDLEKLRDRHEWESDPLELPDEQDTPEMMPGGEGAEEDDGGEESEESDDGEST
jgi:hypothetical protein